jgi:cation:H+ antiporter
MGVESIAGLMAGLAMLVAGAELLVRGASRLATALGVSPLVIGLTVVAFGTSSPELAVSVQATLAGQSDIALGNVVGSNIFNVLFILGLSALAAPLVVSQQLVRLDVPIMVLASLVLWIMTADGALGRFDGAILFAGVVGYTLFLVRLSRKETAAVRAEYAQAFGEPGPRARSAFLDSMLVLAGLALLVLGARLLVNAAVTLATALGVSELVIGLTIVAAGTSLPELATSLLASVRGERDIAVGNIVGSNIFNILAILGISGLVSTDGVTAAPAALSFDIPVMVAVAVACMPIFFSSHTIARWEGALFLAYYAAYTLYIVLDVTKHAALPVYGRVMALFVLPLTAIGLGVGVVRALQQRMAARRRE